MGSSCVNYPGLLAVTSFIMKKQLLFENCKHLSAVCPLYKEGKLCKYRSMKCGIRLLYVKVSQHLA